jgi:predicted amidohydrolase
MNAKQLNMKYLLLIPLSIFFFSCNKEEAPISLFELESGNVDYNNPSSSSSSLNVAVVSLNCSKIKSDNVTKVISKINEIKSAHPETELIVFGEAITGWYYSKTDSKAYIESIAETIPGSFTDTISQLAVQHNCYITFGMAEKSGDTLFNSEILINPSGAIVAVHRKNILTTQDQASGYTAVKNKHTVMIKDFKAGMMNCADVNSVFLFDSYNADKIDFVLGVVASSDKDLSFLPISRRLNAWTLFSNRNGQEDDLTFSGFICVSSPSGSLEVQSQSTENYITYTLRK